MLELVRCVLTNKVRFWLIKREKEGYHKSCYVWYSFYHLYQISSDTIDMHIYHNLIYFFCQPPLFFLREIDSISVKFDVEVNKHSQKLFHPKIELKF